MKKIFAMLLVLALALLPAAMADSWIEEAVEAGRCLTTEISFEGVDALKDYRLALNTQEIGGKYSEFALLKGGEEILNGFVSEDEEATYFSASLFGDKVLAFREGDPAKTVQNIMGMLQDFGVISSEDIGMLEENGFGLSSGFGLNLKNIDLENLDLTPLLTAVSGLEDCISMVEPEEEGFAGEIIVQITPDNAKTILDALLETLSSDPQLGELLKKYADPIGEAEAKVLGKLKGDLVIDVLLDEMGAPCYVSITLDTEAEGAVRTFVFEFALNSGDGNAIDVEVKGSCFEGEDAAQTLFEGSVIVDDTATTASLVVGENGVFTLNAVIPTPVETDTSYQMSADLDVSGVREDQEFAYHLEIASEEQDLGIDAARTTVVAIRDAAAQKEIGTLTVEQATGEAIDAAPVTNAVYPAEMDSSELTGLGMDLLMNGMSLLEKFGVDIPLEALM